LFVSYIYAVILFFRLLSESQVFAIHGKMKNARYKVFDSFRKATIGE